MPKLVYILCALTSIVCAFLLFRQHVRTRGRLVFWSTGCFVCFALTNLLLFVDLVMLPQIDLSVFRSLLTLAGISMMLYGLIRQNN
jgi:drug/metabolite transporter superfamily protein YnfA